MTQKANMNNDNKTEPTFLVKTLFNQKNKKPQATKPTSHLYINSYQSVFNLYTHTHTQIEKNDSVFNNIQFKQTSTSNIWHHSASRSKS